MLCCLVYVLDVMQVPVKWMAPESILERRYTIKSDVWSFGVLCWEVFSSGKAPFDEMTPEAFVVATLNRGVRLEQPERCPRPLYVHHCDVVTVFHGLQVRHDAGVLAAEPRGAASVGRGCGRVPGCGFILV